MWENQRLRRIIQTRPHLREGDPRETERQEMSREHPVKVWDKPYVVSADQTSNGAWIAVGDYMGEQITVEARSEFAAVALWRKTVRHRGN